MKYVIFSFPEHPGNWNTGSEGVLELDPSTGVARAVSSGRAVFYHNVDDMVDTHTEVSINYLYRSMIMIGTVSII